MQCRNVQWCDVAMCNFENIQGQFKTYVSNSNLFLPILWLRLNYVTRRSRPTYVTFVLACFDQDCRFYFSCYTTLRPVFETTHFVALCLVRITTCGWKAGQRGLPGRKKMCWGPTYCMLFKPINHCFLSQHRNCLVISNSSTRFQANDCKGQCLNVSAEETEKLLRE